MQRQITHIAPFQTAKVVGGTYFLLLALLMLLTGLASPFVPHEQRIGLVPALFTPFLGAIVAFVVVFIVCLFYNLVAKFAGGVEYTANDTRDF